MPPTSAADFLVNEPPASVYATLILAHGAGAGMDSQPLRSFAESLAAQNIRVVRFEFPYMHLRSTAGKRGAPDRPDVLLQSWRDTIGQVRAGAAPSDKLFIGGKSLGGRIASMVAAEPYAAEQIAGLICLGYPFHPPGKPQQLRTAHLKTLVVPTLILQGERDSFGTRAEVAAYDLSPAIRIEWIPDGDHSFRPRRQSGRTERQNVDAAVSHILAFISALL